MHTLRGEVGQRIAGVPLPAEERAARDPVCPKCGSDDPSMIEQVVQGHWFCNTCSYDWAPLAARRFRSLDDFVAQSGARRDEVVMLAEVGALNAFGYDRRSALWQAERAVRPAGALFADGEAIDPVALEDVAACPLEPMTEADRLVADYAGTGLTIGRHPMALRRDELATRGVLRARDLTTARHGRRVRVAGMVITRQRPGTAKGFVFLTLEDETGVANIIVRPDLFAHDHVVIVHESFLLVDGVLQHQDGVVSVRAEQVQPLAGRSLAFEAHDFY